MAAVSVFVSSPLKVFLHVIQTAAGLGFSQEPSPRNHVCSGFYTSPGSPGAVFPHTLLSACCAHKEVIWSWFPKTFLRVLVCHKMGT